MKIKNVIVIGAGPSGLAAALSALKEGASVLVLEHMNEPGKKLLLTGNGQCNLSNTDLSISHYHGITAAAETVLRSFTYEDMIAFMSEISVGTETIRYRFEDCGYLYPADHKAETVRNAFVARIRELNGRIITDAEIRNVKQKAETGGFTVETDADSFDADSVIFATGSNACPKTGSDSSIYPLLKSLGIVQKRWLPALTAIRSGSKELKALSGLRADGILTLRDLTTGEIHTSPMGEVQFREHYISGLPALQISRFAAIGSNENHELKLDIHLIRANNKDGKLPFTELMLDVNGTEGFDHSICCSGGVSEEDINVLTFECRKTGSLYFAGEMIDVDGDCGGYNLHFAIGSGIIAGRNAAR